MQFPTEGVGYDEKAHEAYSWRHCAAIPNCLASVGPEVLIEVSWDRL